MRWIYLVMIALAAFTYMNYQVMKQSYGWETYGMEQYQSNLDLARQVRDNIAQSPGAEQVLSDTEDDITRLFSILQAGRTGDADAQVRGLLEYEQSKLEHMTQGLLTGDSAEQSRIVEHLRAVVDSGNLVIYSSLGELPAFVVLPKLLIGIVPYWAGLAIPVLLFGIAFVSDPFTDRRSFERLSPVSASSLLISKLLTVGIFAVFALLIAVLPAFIDATIRNGLGSLAYPTLTLGHQMESGFKVVSEAICSANMACNILLPFCF